MADSYETYVEERFQGEVYGEAFFRSWAAVVGDPALARKLRHLEQLESETRAKLARELRALGRPATEDASRREQGEALAAQFAGAPFAELLKGFGEHLPALIEAFERAEGLAPPGKGPLLRQVTDHERALLAFAEREIEGRDDSLEPVIALLEKLPG